MIDGWSLQRDSKDSCTKSFLSWKRRKSVGWEKNPNQFPWEGEEQNVYGGKIGVL